MEKQILFGIILLTGFIMAVSAASLYVQSHILEGTVCGCEFPIELIIPLLSSAGVLIGSLVYYFLSDTGTGKGGIKDFRPLLDLLDFDEKILIKTIANNGGKIAQSRLVRESGLNKVKVSRLVADLENKGSVIKSSKGVTNEVELSKELKGLLV